MRAFILGLFLLLSSASAHAASAEWLILIDTSSSMNDASGGPDGETKLDAAKALAFKVAEIAGKNGHRVGLMRFRQRTDTVMTGTGTRQVVSDDTEACQKGMDLLVPIAAKGDKGVLAWLDGVNAPGNPELVAVGDSPLHKAVLGSIFYINGRRLVSRASHA